MSLNDEYYRRSLRIAPGGVHSPVRAFKSVEGQPLFFKGAHGAFLQSVDGQEYIDFCQSFGPLILGHRDEEVTSTVQKQIETAWTFGACEPYSLELAEWITSRISWVEKIRFVSSGTEAVMSALRVARAATKRNKILKFEGCYHGHSDSLLVKAGSGLAGESISDSAGVSEATASETLTAALDDDAAVERVFSQHGAEIAAVIIEPLPANYGLLIQRKEFLKNVFDLAKKSGTLVILDEVISGFRVGLGGMAEILDFKPDLVTYGKIIGGGFPVGAYGGRSDLMSLVAPQGPVYQAGTLSANPVGMVAGLATLKKLDRENVFATLEKNAETFVLGINTTAKELSLPLQAIRFGSIFWLHAKTSKPIRAISEIPEGHKQNYTKLFHQLIKNGIYFAPSAYEVGFLSLAHTPEILNRSLDKIRTSLKGAYEV